MRRRFQASGEDRGQDEAQGKEVESRFRSKAGRHASRPGRFLDPLAGPILHELSRRARAAFHFASDSTAPTLYVRLTIRRALRQLE